MTITTTESNNTWTADGISNEFSFTFPILDETDLLIKKRTPSGLLINMVLGIDYTVTGIDNLPERTNYKSGKIIFLQNIPAGSKVCIERNVPKTQEIDYVENTGLPAQGREEALDKITMALQELNADSKKAITLAPDVENIIPEISNVKPDDFLKIAPDGSGIIGIKFENNTGIYSISQDNSPTLSNTLDTNGHDIRFQSDHGLVNSADNPILTVKYDDQNTSHLEIDTTKEHQQPIIRATSDNENTNLMLEAKGNGSITTLNNLNAIQGISVTGTIQATDNENDDADLVLNSKGSGNTIIDDVPVVNEINTIENTVTTLANNINTANNKVDNLNDTINTLNENINTLENKVNTIEESNIPDIENNIATALNKVNAIENNVTTALNKVDNLKNEYNALENTITTLFNKVNAADNISSNLENTITTSLNKLNTLEGIINPLENTITNSLNKINNIENAFPNIENNITTMKPLTTTSEKVTWMFNANKYGFLFRLDIKNKIILGYIKCEFYLYAKFIPDTGNDTCEILYGLTDPNSTYEDYNEKMTSTPLYDKCSLHLSYHETGNTFSKILNTKISKVDNRVEGYRPYMPIPMNENESESEKEENAKKIGIAKFESDNPNVKTLELMRINYGIHVLGSPLRGTRPLDIPSNGNEIHIHIRPSQYNKKSLENDEEIKNLNQYMIIYPEAVGKFCDQCGGFNPETNVYWRGERNFLEFDVSMTCYMENLGTVNIPWYLCIPEYLGKFEGHIKDYDWNLEQFIGPMPE